MPPRRDLGRRTGTRRPRRTILIVCEGEQTEYKYFQALKKDLRLASTRIEVARGESESRAIVREAARRNVEERFDEVWCVFDHEFPSDNFGFAPAVAMADEQEFNLAVSNPAFEFWLLLHFRHTTQGFSSNVDLRATLRREYPEYEKNRDCYDELRDKRDQAVTNAEQVLREQKRASPDERFPHPSTHVHLLVQRLARQRDFRG